MRNENGLPLEFSFVETIYNWNHIKSNKVENLIHKFIFKLIIAVDNTSVVPSNSFVNNSHLKGCSELKKSRTFQWYWDELLPSAFVVESVMVIKTI